MLKKLMVICFAVVAFNAHAQSPNIQTDTIQWNASGYTNLISGDSVSIGCQFITYGLMKIDWVQDNGAYTVSSTVSGTTGSWPDLGATGSIALPVTFDTMTGTIIFAKGDQGITAHLTLTGNSANINLSYNISSLQKL